MALMFPSILAEDDGGGRVGPPGIPLCTPLSHTFIGEQPAETIERVGVHQHVRHRPVQVTDQSEWVICEAKGHVDYSHPARAQPPQERGENSLALSRGNMLENPH